MVVRLRALSITLAGSGAGTDQFVVRDGPTGTGTIIAQFDLSIAANGFAGMQWTNVDYRASLGNAITVEGVSGVTSDREAISIEGDFIPQGYPLFLS